MKICPKCNKEHQNNGVFCSRICANSRVHSEATKRKIAETLMSSGKRFQPPPNPKKIRPPKQPKQQGGFREGSGRSKSGYYKGIFCHSTYELVFLIYCLDNNIDCKRFQGYLTDGNIKYFPDFIVDKTIYEIKGYDYDNKTEAKAEIARNCGYDIKVLFKVDLKEQFDYVKEKYNTRIFYDLYDNHKPKFSYTCSNCSGEFDKEVALKTSEKFCSQRCAGLFRSLLRYK
jgi:hypothetical protein